MLFRSLQHNKVDVNLQCSTDGSTALDIARKMEKIDVALLLEEYVER